MVIGFGGRIAVGLSTVVVTMAALSLPATLPAQASPAAEVQVVVRSATAASAAGAVVASGGHVLRSMPALGMVAAAVPEPDVAGLSGQPGIEGVAPDRPLTVASSGGSDAGLTVSTTPSVFRQQVGADILASASPADVGTGAVVALIDTGVSPVADLAGRLLTGLQNPVDPHGPPVDCINFSSDPTCRDGYGHGTFMAGLIAGTGAASDGLFTGVAPGARIIDIKVASAHGSTDLIRVLAGIDWAISFHHQYGISVLNLSLGVPAVTDPAHDPLDVAAEMAWRAGVAVVAAAGNSGPQAGTVTSPGDDPLVITAGAVDDHGKLGPTDDTAAPFSSEGPTAAGVAKPDLAAPGVDIIGLQAPGSVISRIPTEEDLTAPDYGGAYRRGSGTSMAAAITSGVAALLWSDWSAQPGFSPADWPDRLKAALIGTASRLVDGSSPEAVGAGLVDAAAAASSTAASSTATPASPTGGGGPGWWSPRTWYSGPFAGQSWEGQSWEGQSWEGQSWEGQSWEGQSWEGQSWEGQSWEGQSWEGFFD